MCSVKNDPAFELGLLAMNSIIALQTADQEDTAPLDYLSGLASLEHAQASARLDARHAVADAVSQRQNQQRQAAQEGGQTRAAYGASGLSLSSGSRLALVGDQAAKAQSDADDITRRAAQNLEAQRLNENFAGARKELLYESYRQNRRNSKNASLLTNYGLARDVATGLRGIIING